MEFVNLAQGDLRRNRNCCLSEDEPRECGDERVISVDDTELFEIESLAKSHVAIGWSSLT